MPDPLKAADDALYFKRFVKGIARKYALAASFMAKPFLDRAGNGFHVHFSLLDRDGRNVFDNGTAEGSEMMRHAVGGVLSMMRASSLIFAPHRNSYRRLTPNAHVAIRGHLGLRDAGGGGAHPGRVERGAADRASGGGGGRQPLPGAGGDPRRGAGGHRERGIEPPEPMVTTDDDGATLPIDWKQAIDAFERSEAMARIFAPILRETFVGMKKQELQVFSQQISPFEHETYLETV